MLSTALTDCTSRPSQEPQEATQRAQYPLIKQYTLNYKGASYYDLSYNSLIKGFGLFGLGFRMGQV